MDHARAYLGRNVIRSIESRIPASYVCNWYIPGAFRQWHGHWLRNSLRRNVQKAVREFSIDLILAAWAYPDGWAAVELGRELDIPVVIKVHGSDVLELDRYPEKRRPTRHGLRAADGVVAVSQDLKDHVLRMGVPSGKVHVQYDGVAANFSPGIRREARAKLGWPEEQKTILFVGRLVPVKGLETLIRACGKLHRAGRAFVCNLVGSGSEREAILRQAKSEGVGQHVRIVGERDHDELPNWYRASDVFVLPSRSEGTPCVLREAIACHTRFVASRVGGVPEVARFGHGELVTADNASALAQALADALDAPPLDLTTYRPLPSHRESAEQLHEYLAKVQRGFAASSDPLEVRFARANASTKVELGTRCARAVEDRADQY